jgi:LEA14-like dessication related protein
VAELTQSINVSREEIKLTRSEVDGVGKSQGMVAEEFYANSLTLNPKIGKLKFDQVMTGIKVGKGHDNAQFDVVMINGNSVAIVEVKYRAQIKTIAQLDKQMIEFRARLPIYDTFKLYGGIAGFSVSDNVVQAAHDKGYFVLKRSGDAFAVDTQGMKAF